MLHTFHSEQPGSEELEQRIQTLEQELAHYQEHQREIESSRQFFLSAFDAQSDHVALLNAQGEILHVNKAWRRFSEANAARPETVSEGVNYLLVCDQARGDFSEEAGPFAQGIRNVLAGKTAVFTLEYPCHARDQVRWFCGRVTPFAHEGARYALVSHENITERKLAEHSLHEARLRQEEAVKATNIGFWDWDLQSNTVIYSREWKQQIGYADHEISTSLDEWKSRVHPEDLDRAMSTIQESLEQGQPGFLMEFRFQHKNGSYRWIMAQASFLDNGQEPPVRALGSHVDITDLKQAEAALQESENKFRAIFEGAEDGILLADTTSRQLSMANDRICEMLGYSQSEILTLTVEDLHPEDERPGILEAFAQQVNSERKVIENVQVRRKDGTTFFADITGSPLHINDQDLLAGIFRDVSDRKRNQEAIAYKNQLERTFSDLSTYLLNTTDIEEISFRVLETAKELTGCHFGIVGSIDPKTGHFISHSMSRDIWDQCDVPDKSIVFEKFAGLWGWVLEHQQSILVNDAPNDPRSNGTPPGHIPIERFLGVPALIKDRLVGLIALANPEYRFLATDLVLIKRLATIYALAIQRRQFETALLEAESQKAEELERLVQARTAELLQSREEIKEREKHLRTVADFTYDWEDWRAPEGHYLYISPSCERITGYPREAFLQDSSLTLDIIHPDDRARLARHIESEQTDQEIHQLDFRIINRQGEVRWLSHYCQPVFDQDGTWLGRRGSSRDITQRKLAENQLKRNQDLLQAVFDGISDPLYLVDAGMQIKIVNKVVTQFFEGSAEALTGQTCYAAFFGRTAICDNCRIREAIRDNERTTYERPGCLDPRKVEQVNIYPLRLEQDEPGAIVHFRDITKAKQLEQELLQADKMISLGVLVSGVAHEINNPNNFIMLNAPLLQEAWQGIAPVLDQVHAEQGDFHIGGLPYSEMREWFPRLLSGIEEGSQRIKEIVRGLKDFSRRNEADLNHDVSVGQVVEEAVVLTNNLIKQSTNNFSLNLDSDLPLIKGNHQKLEQVVINLVQNACQALPTADRALSVRAIPDPRRGGVIIEVSDEGQGIPREALPRIMDPFFTTKRTSGGTGLGLSVSLNIVKEHGGSIDVSSTEGQGTTMSVFLPAPRN